METVKALIVPHAGYAYSGLTAGHGYKYLEKLKGTVRVYLLGPSHKLGFPCVALSQLDSYCTPLGDLKVDNQMMTQLEEECKQAGIEYVYTKKAHEENEHSLEMHLPFLAHLAS